MKCDLCGKEIGTDAAVDTHSEGVSGRGRGNKTVLITMCRACANSRMATQRMFLWAFVGLIAIGVVLAIVRSLT